MLNVMEYSYTKIMEGEQIINFIKKFTNKNNIIVDGTAGTGSDARRFMKNFKKVIIVEKNKEIYDTYLKDLKNSYNISINKFINENSLRYDIIYLDPPWGGPDYRTERCLELKLSGIKLEKIIGKLIGLNKKIFIKVPYNATGLPKPNAVCPVYSKWGFSFFIFYYS